MILIRDNGTDAADTYSVKAKEEVKKLIGLRHEKKSNFPNVLCQTVLSDGHSLYCYELYGTLGPVSTKPTTLSTVHLINMFPQRIHINRNDTSTNRTDVSFSARRHA